MKALMDGADIEPDPNSLDVADKSEEPRAF